MPAISSLCSTFRFPHVRVALFLRERVDVLAVPPHARLERGIHRLPPAHLVEKRLLAVAPVT